MKVAAVEFQGVSKFFGEVRANADISFRVEPGTIHAIVGENGAGKSTAMKILFGLYQPDEGTVLVNGSPIQFKSPIDAIAAKIGMVQQHFMLAEPFSALDNILLQQKGSAFSLLRRNEEKEKLHDLAEKYGFHLDLDAKVETLSVGEQQRLEILKILSQESEILILDEPTAVLTPQEVQDLFKNLRRLKEEGKTILIITHKLKEVINLTDSVTVFRAGRIVGHSKTSDTTTERLAEMMIGRYPISAQERTTAVDLNKSVLSLERVSATFGNNSIHNITFSVHSREIVGVAGVEGNGQDVLIRTVLDRGSLQNLSGRISSLGAIGAFPEDRLRFGALPSRPNFENFILGQHKTSAFSRKFWLRTKNILKKTKEIMDKYDIRPHNPTLTFDKMSGGNQQKLVVARALSQHPQIIIAAQPTRGVDIGAIEFIHDEVRKARDAGAGTLLISSELDELMALSDRIVVLYKGKIVKEFTRQQFDEIELGKAMGGGQ